jgi:hypothetical protein
MLFDVRPQLPIAELHSRSWAASLRARSRAVVMARLAWLRPRALPLVVAITSAFVLLGAADYLSNLARRVPANSPVARSEVRKAEAKRTEPAVIEIDLLDRLDLITILDGEPMGPLRELAVSPSRCGLDVTSVER